MTYQIVSKAQANLKLALWQVEADSMNSSDLYVWLDSAGLPYEVTTRLHNLANYTETAGNKVISVGKIVLIKLIEFVKAHPNLAVGIALGTAVGALANSIPFIGFLLAPLATALGITIGAIAGHRLDKRAQGMQTSSGMIGVAEDIIEIARSFFQLLIDVFNIIWQNI